MIRARDLHPETWQAATHALLRSNQAILISGRQGLGKTGIAMELATWLLCEENSNQQNDTACGECISCKLSSIHEHPDWQWLILLQKHREINAWYQGKSGNETYAMPTFDGENKPIILREIITIKALKEKNNFLSLSATRGGRRILIINPADAMNTSAANALLKTLEEPSKGLQFILLAEHLAKIPATIKSRCRVIPVVTPKPAVSLTWLQERLPQSTASACERALKMAGGAPTMASFWLSQHQWLSDWDKSLQATGFPLMMWADKLAEPIKKSKVSSSATAIKAKTKSRKTKSKKLIATPLSENINDETIAHIGVNTALEIFQRKVMDRLWQQFDLPPPFQTDEDAKKTNIDKADLPALSMLQVHKLFYLLDEIVFFRKMGAFTPNAQPVLERLLLLWGQIK